MNQNKQYKLQKMKLFTTSLLFVAGGFLYLSFVLDCHWLRAVSEAALIGGIADWFAVEALFRHPLGLPIPHTAIIPKSKDENGMEVSTQSSYNEEILRIIQQWMPHILILSPESLKERLKERVKGYLETI